MSSSYPTSTTSNRSAPSRRKWFVDFQLRKNERSAGATTASSETRIIAATTTTTAAANNDDLFLLPVGYSEQRVADVVTKEDDDRLLSKRSWDIALQPIKQLPMNVILAWMAGNTFSLMSIMIVVMLFMKPIQVRRIECVLSRIRNKRPANCMLSFSRSFLYGQHLHHCNRKALQAIFGYSSSSTCSVI
jgi:hypothetical protein